MEGKPRHSGPSLQLVLGIVLLTFGGKSSAASGISGGKGHAQLPYSILVAQRTEVGRASRDATGVALLHLVQLPSPSPLAQATDQRTGRSPDAKAATPGRAVNTGSAFDGEWYSSTHRYGFRIERDVGIATVSSSAAFRPGDVILKFRQDWTDTFIGEQLHADGRWYRVRGRLAPDGTIHMYSTPNQTWVMSKRTGSDSQTVASQQSTPPPPTQGSQSFGSIPYGEQQSVLAERVATALTSAGVDVALQRVKIDVASHAAVFLLRQLPDQMSRDISARISTDAFAGLLAVRLTAESYRTVPTTSMGVSDVALAIAVEVVDALVLERYGANEIARQVIRDHAVPAWQAATYRYPQALFSPGGHLKLLHLWPGQTPPPGSRRDEATLLG